MKKFSIFIAIVTIIILAISFLIIKDKLDDTKFSNIVDLINVAQVFVSIYIAYILYDRFGTSKKILDKQADIILEYIEELKKLQIQIYFVKNEKVHIKMNGNISKDIMFFRREVDISRIILVKSNYFSSNDKIQQLIKLTEHPLFPVAIKNELELFNFKVLTSTFNRSSEEFAFLSFDDETSFNKENWMIPGYHHEHSLSLGEYINKIETLLETIENWVNKETSIKVKLNL